MKKIFIDLEMTPVAASKLPSGGSLRSEVIEIGAVALDERNNVIGSFDEFVRPVHTDHVADNITGLTGIGTEQVAQAAPFTEVFPRFLEWCGPVCTFYAWSRNDQAQLIKECDDKGIDADKQLRGWKDFQEIFVRKFGYERRMSLSAAITLAGLDFKGRPHSALADAENTAALYQYTKQPAFRNLTVALRENRRALTVSLGNLFDLAGLAV
ncbi:MAG: exonuclease domain-containing protein [Lachnospiraceae bacterium]|nr:exonuclease domain-containing protein [Lachnospiraceae bacterium]